MGYPRHFKGLPRDFNGIPMKFSGFPYEFKGICLGFPMDLPTLAACGAAFCNSLDIALLCSSTF